MNLFLIGIFFVGFIILLYIDNLLTKKVKAQDNEIKALHNALSTYQNFDFPEVEIISEEKIQSE